MPCVGGEVSPRCHEEDELPPANDVHLAGWRLGVPWSRGSPHCPIGHSYCRSRLESFVRYCVSAFDSSGSLTLRYHCNVDVIMVEVSIERPSVHPSLLEEGEKE